MATILNQELERLAPQITLIHKWVARASIVIFLLVSTFILILAAGAIHNLCTSLPDGDSMGIFEYVASFVIGMFALAFILAAWVSRRITLWLSSLIIRIIHERLNTYAAKKPTN
jgi:hypothetical protein